MNDTTLSRGVLTFAYGHTYQKLAYAQALTLRAFNVPLTVVVPSSNLDFPKLAEVANIVVLDISTEKFGWEAYAYDLSPYDTTLKTDADLIWPTPTVFNIGTYFDQVELLGIASGVSCNLDSKRVDCTQYRPIESQLDWPCFYSAVSGFTKEKGKPLFEYSKQLFSDWWKLPSLVYNLPATTDSVFSLAYRDVLGTNAIPLGLKFIHAKSGICGHTFTDRWSQTTPYHIDREGCVYVKGRHLELPFHYFDKGFMSDNLLTGLEKCSSLITV